MKLHPLLLPALLVLLVTSCHRNAAYTTAGQAYDPILSAMVRGYQTRWADVDDAAVNPVYRMNLRTGGYALLDIDQDGVEELLIGDDFGGGLYAIYDIYTFDSDRHQLLHLLSGGERDRYHLTASGLLAETGSSSATDSFVKYWRLFGTQVTEADAPAEADSALIALRPFFLDASPDSLVMEVAVRNGDVIGRVVEYRKFSYLLEAQDTFSVSFDEVVLAYCAAICGDGIVSLAGFDVVPLYDLPDASVTPVATLRNTEGELPLTFPCRGYIVPALEDSAPFFIIEVDDGLRYLPAGKARWDAINTF